MGDVTKMKLWASYVIYYIILSNCKLFDIILLNASWIDCKYWSNFDKIDNIYDLSMWFLCRDKNWENLFRTKNWFQVLKFILW